MIEDCCYLVFESADAAGGEGDDEDHGGVGPELVGEVVVLQSILYLYTHNYMRGNIRDHYKQPLPSVEIIEVEVKGGPVLRLLSG